MKIRIIFSVSLILLFAAFSVPADSAEIRISAATSLTDAVKELVADYRTAHPDLALLPNFASSGALAKQIQAGAPADIYISANPNWMDYLQQQGMISDASRVVLLQNRLVVVGAADHSLRSLPQLLDLSRIAICSPKSSPAGKYAEQALTAAGIFSQLVAEEKLVLAKNVRQALLYAERGEVAAALVYRTDALLAKQAELLFEVPQELYRQVIYPAALTRTGAEQVAARDFYAYLSGAGAQQIFRQHGFLIP